MTIKVLSAVSGLAIAVSTAAFADGHASPEAEVLHYWTSGGEAKSVAVLQEEFAAGAPTAAQIKGPAIQEWFEEGVLADISKVAEANNWSSVLPEAKGTWCAAPVNVHRVDWIWANAEVLSANGLETHGGQAWQDATVFEAVALGILGAEGFRKAFVELDMDTIKSDDMVAGRDWNLATAMVMNGEAAFQIMGDWAKGEFMAAGKVPGEDFLCMSTPGEGFLYNVDSFAMFAVEGDNKAVPFCPQTTWQQATKVVHFCLPTHTAWRFAAHRLAQSPIL